MPQIRLFLSILLFSSQLLYAGNWCPKTEKEWAAWRESTIYELNSQRDLDADRLDDCQSDPAQSKFFSDPRFLSCMQPLRSLGRYIRNFSGSESDATKAAAFDHLPTEMGNLPDELAGPSFQKLIQQKPLNRSDLVAFLRQIEKGHPESKIVGFTSVIVDGENIAIYIPGKKVDRWLELSIKNALLAPVVSMIAVQRYEQDGTKLSAARVRFSVFGGGNQSGVSAHFKMKRDNDIAQVQCFNCHRTGAMPIIPMQTKGSSFSYVDGMSDKSVLDFLNKRIEIDSAPEPTVTVPDFIPPIGEANLITRTDAFMLGCAGSKMPLASRKKIKEAMNCASCHNGLGAGVLSYPLGDGGDWGDRHGLGTMEWMTVSGHMPPHSTLDPEERKALFRCLKVEYYGEGVYSNGEYKPKVVGTLSKALLSKKCPTTISRAEAVSGSQAKRPDNMGAATSQAAPASSAK